jgi:hypothetical protein
MKTEQEKQIELISEITLLSQLINYRLVSYSLVFLKTKQRCYLQI